MIDITELLIGIFGDDAQPESVRPISGGDINEAYLICLKNGRRVFLKENTLKNAGFFEAEKEGLSAIRETGTIHVPAVLCAGTASGRSCLMMEYLEAAPPRADYWEHFGKQLAAMHRAPAGKWTNGGKYGFASDNYIGAGRQQNTVCESWIDFFRKYRLEIQFQRAASYFDASEQRAVQGLLDHLEEYLVEPEFPSLLHGDLWGGNFVTGPDGYAWLIDPAVYVDHAEADLAMTELFGGFAPAFYDAYREANPVMPGYADRRDLYNLYHLLNHLNLFGGGYLGSVMRIVRRFDRRKT